MNRNHIRAVLFDLDGTLLDTAPDLVGSLNHVRWHEGLPPVDVADYRQYASKGALGLLRAGMPEDGKHTLQARKACFLDHYERNSFVHTRTFDGVERVLKYLQARAIPWGIVTNKPEYLTVPIIRALEWQDRAACVVCGDSIDYRKPHPAPVLRACRLTGVDAGETYLVGDDQRDMDAADAAGAAAVLAAYGYGAQEVIAAGKAPERVLRRPEDLLGLDGLREVAAVT